MANPFEYIGSSLQNIYLPDKEDEEARKYREEYERMRRELQAKGKEAPPPIYSTRKPKTILGGLLPEYGAGTLRKDRRAEEAAWRQSYDPIAMKRFQDQRVRDEKLRDIAERNRLLNIGSSPGGGPQANQFSPEFREAAGSLLQKGIAARRQDDPRFRRRTPQEENKLQQLLERHAADITAAETAKQSRAKTPAVQQQQRYAEDYWKKLGNLGGPELAAAASAQKSKTETATGKYQAFKAELDKDLASLTADDQLAIRKAAGWLAKIRNMAYSQNPRLHADALTSATRVASQKGTEYLEGAESRRINREVKATVDKDFLDWFKSQEKVPDQAKGFMQQAQWDKLRAIISSYASRGSTGSTPSEIMELMMQYGLQGTGTGTGGTPNQGGSTPPTRPPGSPITVPDHLLPPVLPTP